MKKLIEARERFLLADKMVFRCGLGGGWNEERRDAYREWIEAVCAFAESR